LIFADHRSQHYRMGADSHATLVLRIVAQHGLVRSRDLTERDIPRAILMRLVEAGRLKQVARGLYAPPDQPLSRQHRLAEVSARSSRGVFCLLTALHFHRLLRRAPDAIWLAIPNKARAPGDGGLPLRVVRFSGAALSEGVERYVIDGVPIRVYSVAKTVADCFKFRDRIGVDVALAALRKCRRDRLATDQDLWRFAQICRVTELMRPHLRDTPGTAPDGP
jgi:predicted transcriptional regulator of viral defense system